MNKIIKNKNKIFVLFILFTMFTGILPIKEIAGSIADSVVADVYADETDHGLGPNGGNAAMPGNGTWWRWQGDVGTQQAWTKFTNWLGTKGQAWTLGSAGRFTGGYYMSDVGVWFEPFGTEFKSLCQNSRFIYMLHGGTGYDGWLGWAGSSNLAPFGFTKDADHNRFWANYLTDFGTQFNTGRVIIICSLTNKGGVPTDLAKPDDPIIPHEAPCYVDILETRNPTTTYSFSGVYSVGTTLAPVRPVEYSTWSSSEKSEWDSKHHAQDTGAQKTAFGNFIDNNWATINNLKNLSTSQFQSTWDILQSQANAILSSNYIVAPEINLSAANQQGFAEGGAFTVTEQRRPYTVTANVSIGEQRTRTCTDRWSTQGGVEVAGSRSRTYSSWSAWTEVSRVASDQNVNTGSLTPVQYWQMLNVRCNKAGINAIKSLLGSAVTDVSLDSNAKGSQTLFTKTYTNVSELPFGNSSHANATLRQTAYDTFYTDTSSCNEALVCSVGKQTTASNDSQNNVGGPGTGSNTGLYGAQSNGETSSVFTYFRDNVEQNIRLDLWYPLLTLSANDIKHDSKSNASATRLIFDPNGTPMDDTFTISSSTGSYKNTGTQLASNNIITATSQINRLITNSAWASEANRPQKLNAIWAWKPVIVNRVYTKVSGGGASGSNKYTNASTTESTINAYCDTTLNTSSNQTAKIENNWRTKTLFSTYTSFNNAANKYLQINFMRAVAE